MVKIMNRLRNEDIKKINFDKFKLSKCPACQSSKYENYFKKFKFNYVKCEKCETVFVNPRPTKKMLSDFYTNSKCMTYWSQIYQETKEFRMNEIFIPRLKLIKKILKENEIKKINTLVEIGSGFGWFCELAKKYHIAKKIIAVEPSKVFSQECRKINGIEVRETMIEEQNNLRSDLIVNFELIEHLYSPKPFLEKCYNSLNKNGLLVLTTPNFHGVDIQILKENHDTVLAPNHLNFFNPNSISSLLSDIGFTKISIKTPGIMDIHIILNKLNLISDNNSNIFFKIIKKFESDGIVEDLQKIIQKYNLSSHMLVVAKK